MKRIFLLIAILLFSLAAYPQEAAATGKTSVEAAKSTVVAPASAGVNGEVAATEAAVNADEQTITLRKIFVDGGWIMYIIAALSFIAIALTIFYILTMRASVLYPKKFILEAQDTAENGDIEALRELCNDNSSAAAKIVSATLEQVAVGKEVNYERLRSAMEDEGGRIAGVLWQRLQYLLDVSVISPMVGLLGTVWGMMVSFGGIENGAEFAKKAETLASGISQAMYTTFGGLIVGIVSMALYDVLRGHISKLTSQMEAECASILNRLAPADAKNHVKGFAPKA